MAFAGVVAVGVVSVLLAAACESGSLPAVAARRSDRASVAQVLAKPVAYDSAHVQVEGWCRIEFEGTALYPDRNAWDRRDPSNALWLTLEWPVPDETRALNGQYVLVAGQIDPQRKGHLGVFGGSVTGIESIIVIAAPDLLNR